MHRNLDIGCHDKTFVESSVLPGQDNFLKLSSHFIACYHSLTSCNKQSL